jgi:hypothetical protein
MDGLRGPAISGQSSKLSTGGFMTAAANDESVVARIMEELGHRKHYGQESKVISLGTGAYEEACRLGCILGDTFFGMTLLIDPALKPTCFEIR